MEIKRISASSLSTLKKCSWMYWVQNILKLPQSSNSGALRGSIVHDLMELLRKPKWKRFVNLILNSEDSCENKTINRYIDKKLVQYKLDPNEEVKRVSWEPKYLNNKILICRMIKVGVSLGMFQDTEEWFAEKEFNIEYDGLKLKGYIDQFKISECGKKATIYDFKSSKEMFKGEDLIGNIQAFMYSYAAKHLYPDLEEIVVRFIFLRFNKFQEVKCSKEEIEGFKAYLSYINPYVQNFDINDATSKFAAENEENSWLCGRGSYVCEYRNPFFYWNLLDENGKVLETTKDVKDLEGKAGVIKKEKYLGCPYWLEKNQNR